MNRFTSILLAATLWPAWASAAGSTGTVTLPEALALAEKDNPEILAARRVWEAARAGISQAGSPEKPRVTFERMYAPTGSNVFTAAPEKNISITQEFPVPTVLIDRSRRAARGADRAGESLRDKELDVRSGVKSAYAALFYDEKAIAILEDNAGLLRRFARAAESKYASGKASQVDVLKSQVELSKTLNSLVTARQRRDSDEALLNSLLNRPASSPLSTTGELTSPAPPMDQASLEKDALSERPEVRSAELAVEESRYGVRLARADYWPEFMLLYRWRDMDGGPDSRDAMAGVSVPIWFWRQNAGMRQARAEYEAARAGSQSARNKTAYEVRNLLTRAQASYQLIELYRTSVLPQAEQSLEVTRGAYASDKSDFLDLLDAVRTLRDLRLEHYEHIADYAKDRAELERVIGKELP